MSKVIHLRGGPMDGQRATLETDKEFFECFERPNAPLIWKVPKSAKPVDSIRHQYRRSVKTAHIYVHQP